MSLVRTARSLPPEDGELGRIPPAFAGIISSDDNDVSSPAIEFRGQIGDAAFHTDERRPGECGGLPALLLPLHRSWLVNLVQWRMQVPGEPIPVLRSVRPNDSSDCRSK